MPPKNNSRYAFTQARLDQASQKLFLGPRIPFRYVRRDDNRAHTVKRGDTLWNLAARYFAPLNRLPEHSAAMLYWIIQDFQPTPIHDPTIELAEGATIVIPSVGTVVERVLASPATRTT